MSKRLVVLLGPSAIGKSTIERFIYYNFDKVNVLSVYGKRERRDSDLKYIKLNKETQHNILFYFNNGDYKYGLNPNELSSDKINIISLISNSSANIIYEFCKEENIELEVIYINNTIDYIKKQLSIRGDDDLLKRLEFIKNDGKLNKDIKITIKIDDFDFRTDFEDLIMKIKQEYKFNIKDTTITCKIIALPTIENSHFSFLIENFNLNKYTILTDILGTGVTFEGNGCVKIKTDFLGLDNIFKINELDALNNALKSVIPVEFIRYLNLIKETK